MTYGADHQMGFSLLEVLLAWVISITIMLGILALATENLQNTHHAHLQTIALGCVQEMLERLRVNGTPESRRQELALWNQQNAYLLPQSKGEYFCDEVRRICQVNITWQEHGLHMMQIDALM